MARNPFTSPRVGDVLEGTDQEFGDRKYTVTKVTEDRVLWTGGIIGRSPIDSSTSLDSWKNLNDDFRGTPAPSQRNVFTDPRVGDVIQGINDEKGRNYCVTKVLSGSVHWNKLTDTGKTSDSGTSSFESWKSISHEYTGIPVEFASHVDIPADYTGAKACENVVKCDRCKKEIKGYKYSKRGWTLCDPCNYFLVEAQLQEDKGPSLLSLRPVFHGKGTLEKKPAKRDDFFLGSNLGPDDDV